MPDSTGEKFQQLVAIMARLRAPGGCPWDREQTHESLARYLLEETYETLEAIETGDLVHLREELGDLLLQVYFHARIAAEDADGGFTIDDVAAGIVDLFFARDFSGPWIGAGLEYWWNTIGSPAGPDTASWSSGVATLGGGFVWKLRGNLYLNPWAAGHLLLSRPEVTLYGATWKPGALTGEVSLKVGWYTSL